MVTCSYRKEVFCETETVREVLLVQTASVNVDCRKAE